MKYNPATAGYNRQEQNLLSWVSDRQFRTGKIEFNDYDYLKPPKNLRANKEAAENYTRSSSKFMIIRQNTTKRTRVSSSRSFGSKRNRR